MVLLAPSVGNTERFRATEASVRCARHPYLDAHVAFKSPNRKANGGGEKIKLAFDLDLRQEELYKCILYSERAAIPIVKQRYLPVFNFL